MQGHHPRNLVSEGGGDWDWGPQIYYKNQATSNSYAKHPIADSKHLIKQNWQPNSKSIPIPSSYQMLQNDHNYTGNYWPEDVKPAVGISTWCYGKNRTQIATTIKQEPYWPYEKDYCMNIDYINEKQTYPFIPFGTDPRIDEPIEVYDEKDGSRKQLNPKYVYQGNGGPMQLTNLTGSWCCRKGNYQLVYVLIF